MLDPTIILLRDLVSIDSVNPSLVPGGAGEREIAKAIAAAMRAVGMEVEVQEVAPGRDESKSRPYVREGLPEPVKRRFYRNKAKVHSHGILPSRQDV